MRPRGQEPAALRSLSESLEGSQALHGVEEFRRERRVGALPAAAVADVPAVEGARGDEGNHREGEQDPRARQIHEGHHREHHEGSEGGNEDLRKVLAEPRLELLDPLHYREQHLAGALEAEIGRPEPHHLVEETLAQRELDPRCGTMCDHCAPMLERTAQHHDPRHEGEGGAEIPQIRSAIERRNQPAQQSEAQDPDDRRQNTRDHHQGDPCPHALGELPQTSIKKHDAPLCPAPPPITTAE